MLAVVLASCGSMWNLNWAPQVNCAVPEVAGIYWGRKYISSWNNRFLRVQIYIYMIQNNLLLSHQWNICISLISKVRNARFMLYLPHVLLHSFLLVHSNFILQMLLAVCG